MIISINYGDQKLDLTLPDYVHLDEFRHDPAGKTMDFEAFVVSLDSASVKPFNIEDADLYVLNDAYRMTPSARILDWLDKAGRLNMRAGFLVATGSHRRPNDNELRKIFGGLYERIQPRIIVHDARDHESMIEVGNDDDGQPVYLNRRLVRAEKVVVISSVEPHYFAGFTGGRKSIFPGLCDLETTVRNHNRAVSFRAAPMKLDGNPVEENLRFLMNLFDHKKVFSIQLVLAGENNIQAVFAGDLQDTFRGACELAERIYGRKISDRYDLVLAEARPPLDTNLYQLQKSLENCQGAVIDDGTVVLFSKCREGIGSEDFYRLAESWIPSENDMPEGKSSFGRHKLYRVNKIGQRINVYLYSELDDGIAEKVYFKSIRDPQKLIDKLTEGESKFRAALVRDSGQAVLAN